MSESRNVNDGCSYVVIPDDGRLPFAVHAHPFPDLISDDLGGAVTEAFIVLEQAHAVAFVREDAATTGYQKNLLASVLVTVMNDWRRPTLVVGPAVLTNLVPMGVNPNTGMTVHGSDGFTGRTADQLASVAIDIQNALDGSDGPFETPGLDEPRWAAQVRAFGQRLMAAPIPDSWPDSEAPPQVRPDPISAGLAKAFPGRQFIPWTAAEVPRTT